MNFELITDSEYKHWLTTVKATIQQSQIKAVIQVNVELLKLYWQLGAMIAEKQTTAAWGDKLIEQLSRDLRREFPDLKDFSRTNLLYIRKWYLFYSIGKYKITRVASYSKLVCGGSGAKSQTPSILLGEALF
ncbi:hypothetical protein KFU94_59265 [Chloroflexi bacterium TSY]|nr:hypothetical protein [Chloroflexi bacterium TSY]